MKFKVVEINISTGGPLVVYINREDAGRLNINPKARIEVRNKSKKIVAFADIISTGDIKKGEIGVLKESAKKLRAVPDDIVSVHHISQPLTLHHIKKKLRGEPLDKEEIYEIIDDIKNNLLTEVEVTYFVAACYSNPLSMKETINLTKAMIDSGDTITFAKKNVIDKHCIGGVAGNRTTPIVVSILAAAGYICPKTSSRAITSPAGTADTMEVFCNVNLDKNQMKKVVKKTGGCMVWGGSLDLAPVDDIIINVEQPLSLDPRGQLLASVLSKKKSVNSNNVLIDIPWGKGSKIDDKKEALALKRDFEKVGKAIDLKVHAILTDGCNPIGRGIGPALEALDILKVLSNEKDGVKDLREKSIKLAGKMIDLGGKYKKQSGIKIAREILESGKALKKFCDMCHAQGIENPVRTEAIKSILSSTRKNHKSKKSGTIKQIDNKVIAKVAKIAGAPSHKECGVYLLKKQGEKVKKGEDLFEIYAQNKEKMKYVTEFLKIANPYLIK